MNSLLLSSVHVLGSNSVPPEIDQACVAISVEKNLISLSLSSKPIFERNAVPEGFETVACKPVWEDGGLGMGLKRQPAGRWQTRRRLSENELLAVSTQVIVNGSDLEQPFVLFKYDWAVITVEGSDQSERFVCVRGARNKWNVSLPSAAALPFPYFYGCTDDWRFERARLIECGELEQLRRTTTPVPWVHYPMGKGAYYPPVAPPKKKKIYQSKEEELDRGDRARNRAWHKRRKHGQ